MTLRSTLLMSCAAFGLLASSCSDEVKTGTFTLGNVNQLGYRSESRSGLTDNAGTFEYEGDEEVTFHVGGVVLGTARGADRVSPFDLFDTTPPTDAVSAIYDLQDTASVRPFERGLNVAAFLMSLDNDALPSNGIDLTGRDAQLAEARVDFNMKSTSFVGERAVEVAAQVPNYALRA